MSVRADFGRAALAFPFVVGLIGVAAGAEANPTGPKSTGARIPARAAAPQAVPA